MSAFLAEYGPLLWQGVLETLYMVAGATAGGVALGLPLGVLLFITAPERMAARPGFNKALGAVVNLGRSMPFLILMVAIIPFTRLVAGTTIGPTAAIVPLVVGAAPFIARLVESSLAEVDSGVVEAALCMGATRWQVITRVLLVEARPSLLRGLSIAAITLIGYSAMGGAVGAGGLGDLAIRYGYYRRVASMMWASVVLLMVIVAVFQGILGLTALKTDKKNKA